MAASAATVFHNNENFNDPTHCTMTHFLLAVVLLSAGPAFDAHTLDGETVSGELVSLDSKGLILQTGDGPSTLTMKQLLGLSPETKPQKLDTKPNLWIDLLDGSTIGAKQYLVTDRKVTVTLLDNRTVQLTTAAVAAVRFQEDGDAINEEWNRLLSRKADNDLLVVRKGNALDFHKGALFDVTDERVKFDLGGDLLPVKRSKVFGLVYYHPPNGDLPPAICRIIDNTGSSWAASTITWQDELQWTTPTGSKVRCPLAAIRHIDFSGGKVIFLSDLQPENVSFMPFFGSADDIPGLDRMFSLRTDTNLQAQPLVLGGKKYSKGLAMRSRTEVVYRLPGRFSRFKATAGIDDQVRPNGHVVLTISGDDKQLAQLVLTGSTPPTPIDVDISGVRRLTILSDFGENLDIGDHLDLCEARILK